MYSDRKFCVANCANASQMRNQGRGDRWLQQIESQALDERARATRGAVNTQKTSEDNESSCRRFKDTQLSQGDRRILTHEAECVNLLYEFPRRRWLWKNQIDVFMSAKLAHYIPTGQRAIDTLRHASGTRWMARPKSIPTKQVTYHLQVRDRMNWKLATCSRRFSLLKCRFWWPFN